MSTSSHYTKESLTHLYSRLYKHYVPPPTEEEDDGQPRYVSELVDPEAFFHGLATFALWIFTEPESDRTQRYAAEQDEILSATHHHIIEALKEDQPVSGCLCMETYIEEKVKTLQSILDKENLMDEQRENAEDGLVKWVHRLQLLQ